MDESVIGRALSWLQSRQQADGSFKEPARGAGVINRAMQENPIALTAFVVLSFVDNKYK